MPNFHLQQVRVVPPPLSRRRRSGRRLALGNGPYCVVRWGVAEAGFAGADVCAAAVGGGRFSERSVRTAVSSSDRQQQERGVVVTLAVGCYGAQGTCSCWDS